MRYGLPFAAMAGIVAAHSLGGIPGAPNFVGGRRFLAEMKGKRAALAAAPPVPRAQPQQEEEKRAAKVDARQNTNNQCGPGFGSCAAGYCCSGAGWCGQGTDYCAAPDCQQNYGPGCDANQKPSGADTSGADRTHFGSVTYGGAGIYDCVNAGDIAITFDDGPYLYTSDLLDKLAAYNAKATFFITGNNLGKGMINNAATGYPSLIKRMHAAGHQIASHTWSHQNSSQTSAEQWRQQMIWNEIALNDILGFFPTYMRPPYSICESQCQSILSQLGYHITYFDLDTEGYLHNSADAIGQSKAILDNALASSSPSSDAWLHIEHDIQYYTVYSLMDYMLSQLQAKGWNMVTVGECLGDPEMYWYRTISGTVPSGTSTTTRASTTTSTQPTGTNRVSTDGTCGNGITCQGSQFGNCCSQHGWCGSTTDYCSTGCQPAFGTCSSSSGSSSSSTTKTTTTKTTTSTQPTSTNRISTDGTCGNGVTCLNSGFGNCCSQYGWCGSTTGHCDAATCQPQFGICSGSGTTSGSGTSSGSGTTTRTSTTTKTNTTTKTSSTPTSTAAVSTEGSCGNGITCKGSSFGNCCSQHGWCGSTSAYCGTGCQPSWGTCS